MTKIQSDRPFPENREAFFARLRPILAPSQLMTVEVAYALAKHAHRWQERKELDADGHPVRYFEHLRSTALILIDELGIHDPEMIVACLMHDSIEDTHDINDRMLEHLFGTNVAIMVKLLTKDPKEGYYDRLVKHGNPRTWIVKGCDRLSNLRTLKDTSPEFQAKQYAETRKVIYPLMGLAASTSDIDLAHAASTLRDLIHKTVEG
jgi:(p)ppGpp synthase/HD superfamily hydrolase